MVQVPKITLTEAAKAHLQWVRSDYERISGYQCIPIIMWIDGAVDPGVTTQVGIGLSPVADVAPEDIFTIDGIDLAFSISDDDVAAFDKSAIDYNGAYLFVAPRQPM